MSKTIKIIVVYIIAFMVITQIASVYVAIKNPNVDTENVIAIYNHSQKIGYLSAQLFVIFIFFHILYIIFRKVFKGKSNKIGERE